MAADHGDLDTAATIAVYATFLGCWVEQYEPVEWAEELIEPARAVEHRRLAQLYAMAAQCYSAGRVDDAVDYAEAVQAAIATGRFDEVPYGFESSVGPGYIMKGQPERWVELCRTVITRTPGAHTYTRSCLVLALTVAGDSDEAVAASQCLLAAADATDNPHMACFALLAYGYAQTAADPAAAYETLRRGLTIAQDSGNRTYESHLAGILSRLAATYGDPRDAFDFLTLAIRHYSDSGSFPLLGSPLAILAALLDRLGHHEPAATISGFAATPFGRATVPEITTTITHLRDVLGDQTYESLARKGETMTRAAVATYAYDQIDQARTELNAVSK